MPNLKASKTACRVLRESTGLSQQKFWERISVTQSGGSRYEAGRTMPRPVKRLLTLAYGSEEEAQALLNELRSIDKPTDKKGDTDGK